MKPDRRGERIGGIKLASFPGSFEGGGERAWYTLFAYVRNISGKLNALVICLCYALLSVIMSWVIGIYLISKVS